MIGVALNFRVTACWFLKSKLSALQCSGPSLTEWWVILHAYTTGWHPLHYIKSFCKRSTCAIDLWPRAALYSLLKDPLLWLHAVTDTHTRTHTHGSWSKIGSFCEATAKGGGACLLTSVACVSSGMELIQRLKKVLHGLLMYSLYFSYLSVFLNWSAKMCHYMLSVIIMTPPLISHHLTHWHICGWDMERTWWNFNVIVSVSGPSYQTICLSKLPPSVSPTLSSQWTRDDLCCMHLGSHFTTSNNMLS